MARRAPHGYGQIVPPRRHNLPVTAGRCAFTVVELLVVVAIIAILAALVLTGLEKARTMASVAACLSNQRQISLAQASYALDNGGALASPRTSYGGGSTTATFTNPCGTVSFILNNGSASSTTYHPWTASYGAGVVGGSEVENGLNSTNPLAKALSGGRLFPYIGSFKVYRSPIDPTNRIRSYSLNAFVGVTVPTDAPGYLQVWQTWFCAQGVTPRELVTTHLKMIKDPSHTLMSLVEDDSDGFNFNNEGWLIDPRPPPGSPAPPHALNPAMWGNSGGWSGWVDWPAFWDPSNITYSHVDGSTESYSLQNPRLVSLIQGPPGAGYGHNYPQPADNAATGPWRRDWTHFRDKLLPGTIPAMIRRYQDQ